MQIDMHFYGTYAIARAAGLPPQVAKTVATAAQFVDDATDKDPHNISGQSYIVPVISAHPIVNKANVDPWDQWQVWVPFHFLPGNKGAGIDERLVCRPGTTDNPSAEAIISLASDSLGAPYGWHLLGIVTHVLQDTFSHWGFSGISSAYNHVEQGNIILDDSHNADIIDAISADAGTLWDRFTGSMAEQFSALGHGSVATYPDRPYLVWEFDYEQDLAQCPRQDGGTHIKRRNPDDYLNACQRLFELYAKAAPSGSPMKKFQDIDSTVRDVLTVEKRKDGRIDAWKDAIRGGALFPVEDEDKELSYNEDCWVPGKLRTKPKEQKLQAQLFFKASRTYRCFVLRQLLPELGIL
jgi:hypothetical protein